MNTVEKLDESFQINGYRLADEIFEKIGEDLHHEISIEDTIKIISFFGFNEEASRSTTIGFVCYCARQKIKKIIENALVWCNYDEYNSLIKAIEKNKGEKYPWQEAELQNM